jgi:DNA polymerase III delta prime subunit
MIRDPHHHAHLIIGEFNSIRSELLRSIEESLHVRISGNPDFYEERIEVFGIDEGRRIKELQSTAPLSGDKKITLIAFDSMTHEAQNALLKITEEPPRGIKMIFVTRDKSRLLPTFLSRFSVTEAQVKKEESIEGALFLALHPIERLKHLEKIIKEKDRDKARTTVEQALSEVRRRGIKTKDDARRLEVLAQALSFIGDRSSSVKMILEWVSLVV